MKHLNQALYKGEEHSRLPPFGLNDRNHTNGFLFQQPKQANDDEGKKSAGLNGLFQKQSRSKEKIEGQANEIQDAQLHRQIREGTRQNQKHFMIRLPSSGIKRSFLKRNRKFLSFRRRLIKKYGFKGNKLKNKVLSDLIFNIVEDFAKLENLNSSSKKMDLSQFLSLNEGKISCEEGSVSQQMEALITKTNQLSDQQLKRIRFENQVQRSLIMVLNEIHFQADIRESLSAEQALFLSRKLAIYKIHPNYQQKWHVLSNYAEGKISQNLRGQFQTSKKAFTKGKEQKIQERNINELPQDQEESTQEHPIVFSQFEPETDKRKNVKSRDFSEFFSDHPNFQIPPLESEPFFLNDSEQDFFGVSVASDLNPPKKEYWKYWNEFIGEKKGVNTTYRPERSTSEGFDELI